MIRTHEEHLEHIGVIRRSGRYPWGSGSPESTRNRDFLDAVSMLKRDGLSEAKIAEGMGLTTTQLRARNSIAVAQQRQEKIMEVERLASDGWSNTAIGQRMGINESSVRALRAPGAKDKASANERTANMLRDQVKEKTMIDVGKGVEAQLGITATRLKTALAMLREEGFGLFSVHIPQVTSPGQFTTMQVLAQKGMTHAEVNARRAEVRLINEHSEDGGRSYLATKAPLSVSSRRVGVTYKENGGDKLDGVIYVRPGVKDLSIGENRYGQVRVMIDNTHYLKGMAVYKDDLPDGVDLMVNTNKSNTGRKKDVMKPIEDDPENPFGTIIRQVHDPDTGKVTSAMNLVGSPTREGSGEAGSWDTWSVGLSSQMLSKQDPKFAQKQLDVTYERRLNDLNEINALTNPTVRKDLLQKFADETDASAADLKAASLKRTATKVILPIASIKPTEVYAPTMRDGERVVLIRHPHGGTFEIPELTVNNRNREGRKLIGTDADQKIDAIGIHHKTAQHLSGADFDGDTVLIIPNTRRSVKVTPALQELKGFDPMTYRIPKDSPIPRIDGSRKQKEMGKISNLITDMSLKGAETHELARAVKHSMVVIDAEKHELDYIQSEKDHGILALKEKYQGGKQRGASTLISRAGADTYVLDRQPRRASRGGPIDPVTGKKVYELTGKTRTDPKSGMTVPRKVKSEKLAEAEDAFDLVSDPGTQMEIIYANHANRLKALANASRKESLSISPISYSKSARKTYADEVASIGAKLSLAERNAPRERQAQLHGKVTLSQKRQANPHMDKEEIKRERNRSLTEARIRTGAHKDRIVLTQKEWDAIQAGAISGTKLSKVLYNSDSAHIKKLAMPRKPTVMTSAVQRRAEAMLARGYTQAEVADQLGIGLTTLKTAISE